MSASQDPHAAPPLPAGGRDLDEPADAVADAAEFEDAAESTDRASVRPASVPPRRAHPRAALRPPRWRVCVYLVAALAVVVTFLIVDRHVPPRPRVEVIDQGGLAALQPAELDQIKAQAAGLSYPVTLAFADRPGARNDWERTVHRLAQPDRLAIGVAVGDRSVVVGRGEQLPLAAAQEQAIRSAAVGQVAIGEPERGAQLALAQAQAFGNPLPAAPAAPPLDPPKLRLIASVLAPLVVLTFCLGVIRHRARSRYS